jgi:anthranilate phosphoribosyltransferase
VTAPSTTWLPDTLAILLERRDLNAEQMRGVMEAMLSGGCGELETAAILIALRCKGESAVEVAAAAGVLREHMIRFETGRPDVLDTSGTGGDGIGTFNISTATALVAAGADVPVVKHGNRAVSSRSGSADVLTELGVTVADSVARARRCLDQAGMAFCFAPHFHPVVARVAAIRQRLKVRTLFNSLGPLVNPAAASYQLMGVGRSELLEPLAGALACLGVRRALLVYGQDGLDEVSLSAPTQVREVCGHTVSSWEWTPADFGLAPCLLEELRVEGPRSSAQLIRSVLQGENGPARRIVLANAAAALMAAERVDSPREGVRLASESIDSGRARQVLERLVECSRDVES